MFEHIAALFRCFHHQFEPLPNLYLTGELAEGWRPQRNFKSGIWFRRFHGKRVSHRSTQMKHIFREVALESAGSTAAFTRKLLNLLRHPTFSGTQAACRD